MHGAGDTTVFHPLPGRDVVGIGNWGDEERSREICQFLLRPAEALRDRSFTVYGVRYPAEDTERLFREAISAWCATQAKRARHRGPVER